MKKQLFYLLLFVGIISAHAQDSLTPRIKRVRISEVAVQGGILSKFNPVLNEDAPSNILPVSTMLKMNSFVTDNIDFIGNNNVSALIGIQFADKRNLENKYFVMRLGIGFYNGSYTKNNLFVEDRNTYDSLIESNQTTFLDSVTYRYLDSKYSYQMLRMDGSFLVKTNLPSRWTFFAGLGFTYGVTINSDAETLTRRTLSTEKRYGENYSLKNSNQDISIVNENRDLENIFSYSVYVPVGVDFRIGNNHSLWKKSHLFYEFRSGMNYTNREGMSPQSSVYLHHSFGLKYTL